MNELKWIFKGILFEKPGHKRSILGMTKSSDKTSDYAAHAVWAQNFKSQLTEEQRVKSDCDVCCIG